MAKPTETSKKLQVLEKSQKFQSFWKKLQKSQGFLSRFLLLLILMKKNA